MNDREEAFTLIELLLVTAILGVIIGAIYSTQIVSFRSWNFNRERIDLQQNARIIMQSLTKDMRKTVLIGGNKTFDEIELSLEPGGDHLELSFSEDVTDNDGREYYVENNTLKSNTNGQIRNLGSPIISSLEITGAGNLINIDLELSYKNNKFHLEQKVYSRRANL